MNKHFYSNKLNEYCRTWDRIWWTKYVRAIKKTVLHLIYAAVYSKMFSQVEEECNFYKCCRTCYASLTTKKQLKPHNKIRNCTWVYSPYREHTVPM